VDVDETELEFRGAELGDKRRTSDYSIGSALALGPPRSLPEAMASEGQLGALYRFINNKSVECKSVLAPQPNRGTVSWPSTVLVLHDTTRLEFAGDRAGRDL
jgi:hypothetical protein